jgi:hypothetical protein
MGERSLFSQLARPAAGHARALLLPDALLAAAAAVLGASVANRLNLGAMLFRSRPHTPSGPANSKTTIRTRFGLVDVDRPRRR